MPSAFTDEGPRIIESLNRLDLICDWLPEKVLAVLKAFYGFGKRAHPVRGAWRSRSTNLRLQIWAFDVGQLATRRGSLLATYTVYKRAGISVLDAPSASLN